MIPFENWPDPKMGGCEYNAIYDLCRDIMADHEKDDDIEGILEGTLREIRDWATHLLEEESQKL